MRSSNTWETFFHTCIITLLESDWLQIKAENIIYIEWTKTMYWMYKCWAGTLKTFWYLSWLPLFWNSGAVYWGIDKHIINLHAKHNSKSFSLWRIWLLGGARLCPNTDCWGLLLLLKLKAQKVVCKNRRSETWWLLLQEFGTFNLVLYFRVFL